MSSIHQALIASGQADLLCDPYFNYVVLLLHGDGADNGTVFTDSSLYADTYTATGNAVTKTGQRKFGTASMYFDGSGDWVSAPDSPRWDITGDFTVEAWIYPTGNTGNSQCILGQWQASGGDPTKNNFLFRRDASGLLGFHYMLYPTTYSLNSDSTIPLNQWTHVAACRSGSTIRLFVNGVLQSATRTYGGAFQAGTDKMTAGSSWSTSGGVEFFLGYIDDLRFTNGIGRYTGSFSVPSRAHPDAACTAGSYSAYLLNANTTNTQPATTRGYHVISLGRGDTTPLITGDIIVNPVTLLYGTYSAPSGRPYAQGAASFFDQSVLYASYGDQPHPFTLTLVKYTTAGGMAPTTVLSDFCTHSYGFGAYVSGLKKMTANGPNVYTGVSIGTGNGDRWGVADASTGTSIVQRTLNNEGGMPSHAGIGQSVCEFDGNWYWGGGGSATSSIPLWRTPSATSGTVTWLGGDTTIQSIRTGTIASQTGGVHVIRTSGGSSKRMYLLLDMCNKVGYIPSGSTTWSTVNLPSGEYTAQWPLIQPSDDGKIYFCTIDRVPSDPAVVIRVRSLDESGNFALIGTMPSVATMFPLYTAATVSTAVTPKHASTGAVTGLIVAVISGEGGSAGGTYGDVYVKEFAV